MAYTLEQLRESARVLEARLGDFRPRCLLILGSGLGALADEVEGPVAVPYGEVPHMRRLHRPGPRGPLRLRPPGGAGRGGDAGPAPHL